MGGAGSGAAAGAGPGARVSSARAVVARASARHAANEEASRERRVGMSESQLHRAFLRDPRSASDAVARHAVQRPSQSSSALHAQPHTATRRRRA